MRPLHHRPKIAPDWREGLLTCGNSRGDLLSEGTRRERLALCGYGKSVLRLRYEERGIG